METSRQPLDGAGIGRCVLVVHLLLSPLLFSTATTEGFELCKVALLTFVALLLAALGLSNWIGSGGGFDLARLRDLCREPIVPGVILLLFAAVVSTVWSISPRISWQGADGSYFGLLTTLAYVVLFFATGRLCHDETDARRLLAVSVIGAAVAATYALLQVAHLDPITWTKVSNVDAYIRPFATMGHPNLLAAFLVMTFPLTIYLAMRAVQQRHWPGVLVFTFVSILSCLAIIFAVSRGAWLAFVLMALALAIGWTGRAGGNVRRKAFSIPGLCVGLVLAALVVAGCWQASVIERLRHLFDDERRLLLWQSAWALFQDNPWCGSGLDTFHLAFPRHRSVGYTLLEWNATPARAHNEFLQALATQGLLGVGALVGLTVGLLRASRDAWRQASAERRALLVAIFASLIGFAVQSLFSFTVAGCGTLFVTCAALLSRFAGATPARDASQPWGRSYSRSLIVGGILVALMFAFNTEMTEDATTRDELSCLIVVGALLSVTWTVLASQTGTETARVRPCKEPALPWSRPAVWLQLGVWVGAALLAVRVIGIPLYANHLCRLGEQESDPGVALARFERALAIDPDSDYYWTRLGQRALLASKDAATADDRRCLIEQARQAFARCREIEPVKADYHAGMARALAELARLKGAPAGEAFLEYDRALADDPNNPLFLADAANSALAVRDFDRARRYIDHGLELYPRSGLLRAHLGYLAITQQRFDDAVLILDEAILECSWYEEAAGLLFAHAMRQQTNQLRQRLQSGRQGPQ